MGHMMRVSCAMRRGIGTLLCSVLLLTACEATDTTPEPNIVPEDTSPATDYTVRLDSERSDPGQFRLARGGEGLRILTGPAGIAYRTEDAVTSGDFRVEAIFVQYSAPVGYREAFGIFVGGRELDAPDHEYTYLLVRTTGDYLIKRRLGEITEVVVDWTPHDAVVRVNAEGDEPTNMMAVEVVDGETRFIINGEVVHAMPASQARPYGIAGIRANHRLDVSMNGWGLTTGASES